MARPMPRDEPVTTATRPCSRFAVLGAPSRSTSFSLSMTPSAVGPFAWTTHGASEAPLAPGESAGGVGRKRMLQYTHVRTAVIVATYDQPRWLELALRAWARQELPPSHVVVAD